MFGRCLFIGAPATSMINVNICGIDPLPLLAMTGVVLGIIGENNISVVKAVEGGFLFQWGIFLLVCRPSKRCSCYSCYTYLNSGLFQCY